MPALLVGEHDLAHIREHPRFDVTEEQPLADLVKLGQLLTFEIARGPHDEPLELHPPEAVADRRLEHAEDLTDPGLSAPDPIACVRRRSEP